MLQSIEGYFINMITDGFFTLEYVHQIPQPGTNVYANISLSSVNTETSAAGPDPKFAAIAYVRTWTVYDPDGTESPPQGGSKFTQNAVLVNNCARITFQLIGNRVNAVAQINIITL
jgi:hypothetical protein